MRLPTGESRRPQPFIRAVLGGLWALALIATVQFPSAVSANLDSSWQLVLSHAFLHDLRLGQDIIFTYGPLGFLENNVQLPTLLVGQILWQVITRLAVLGLLVFGMRSTLPWLQVGVFLAVLIMTTAPLPPSVPANDAFFMVAIWLAGATLLKEGGKSIGLGLLSVFVLVTFSLVKLSIAVPAFAIVATVTVYYCWRLGWGRGLVFAAVFGTSWLVGWRLSGHSFSLLGDFARNASLSIAGYGDAMVIAGARGKYLAAAALLAALFLGFVVARVVYRRKEPAVVALGAITVGLLLIAWRHASCRADSFHLAGLIVWIGVVVLLWLAMEERGAGRPSLLPPIVAVAAMTALGGLLFLPGLQLAQRKANALRQNLVAAVRLVVAPARLLEEWRQTQQRFRDEIELRTIRAAVGDAALDVHGHVQAHAILGGYRYVPRPVPQSYAAYTSELAERNLTWLRTTKPPFTLMKVESIDGRLPALDDAPGLVWNLKASRVAAEERGFVLLARDASLGTDGLETSTTGTVNLGAWWPVPLSNETQPCYLKVDAAFSLAGRLSRNLFPIRPLLLEVKFSSGLVETYNLPLRMAQTGFLIRPFVRENADVVQWLKNKTTHSVTELRISAPGASWAYRNTLLTTFVASSAKGQ